LVYGFDITVVTGALTVNELPKENSLRLDLIIKLSSQGLSNKEISGYLNGNLISPFKAKEYNPKLIWSTLKKIRLREERKLDTKISIGKPSFYERVRKI